MEVGHPRTLKPMQLPTYDVWAHICGHCDAPTVKNIYCTSKDNAQTCKPILWRSVTIHGGERGPTGLDEYTINGPDPEDYCDWFPRFHQSIRVLNFIFHSRPSIARSVKCLTLIPPRLPVWWLDQVGVWCMRDWDRAMKPLNTMMTTLVNLQRLNLQNLGLDPRSELKDWAASAALSIAPALSARGAFLKELEMTIPLEDLPAGFFSGFPRLQRLSISGNCSPCNPKRTSEAVQLLGGIPSATTAELRSILDLPLVQDSHLETLTITDCLSIGNAKLSQFLAPLKNSRYSLRRLRVVLPGDSGDWYCFFEQVLPQFPNLEVLFVQEDDKCFFPEVVEQEFILGRRFWHFAPITCYGFRAVRCSHVWRAQT